MKLMPWRSKKASTTSEPAPLSRPDSWDLDTLFDRFLSNSWFGGGSLSGDLFGSRFPPVDIAESDDEVVIRSEVPGVDPEALSITVTGDILTLAGEKSESREHKGENCYHAERRFGSFRRNVELPSTVDSEDVKAEYENGVLTVTLRRKEGATVKRIPVSAKK